MRDPEYGSQEEKWTTDWNMKQDIGTIVSYTIQW